MTRGIHIAAFAGMLAACGGKPVGSNVPRPDHTKVAAVAAAAATAVTLANPDAAGRKPEDDEQVTERRLKKRSNEHVPADVLDRMDKDAGERPRCKDEPRRQALPADHDVELIPTYEPADRPRQDDCEPEADDPPENKPDTDK